MQKPGVTQELGDRIQFPVMSNLADTPPCKSVTFFSLIQARLRWLLSCWDASSPSSISLWKWCYRGTKQKSWGIRWVSIISSVSENGGSRGSKVFWLSSVVFSNLCWCVYFSPIWWLFLLLFWMYWCIAWRRKCAVKKQSYTFITAFIICKKRWNSVCLDGVVV